MPDMDGFETCQRLMADENINRIPVIMITAIKTDSQSRIKGLEVGANTFLAKPIDEYELISQIKVALRIKKAEDALRKERDSLEQIVVERTAAQEKLQAQFTQSQKMESIGRLAGGVAHDLNNMLGVIIGHTELVMDIIDSSNSVYEDLEEIRKAAERCANLTRQLLAFARKQIISPKVIDLNRTVKDMLKMLERIIGEDIELRWEPKDDLWSIKVDPSQVDQILANLCVNARDAIKSVGTLTIKTDNVTLDQKWCSNQPELIEGEYVVLSVIDTGCGMDSKTLENIFEPFFTTKEIGKGTGLGLSTVYGIVKQNNGFIDVQSECGQGTKFNIYIPRYISKNQLMQKELLIEEESARSGCETILLVEDEPAILKLTKTMLEKQGYTVLAASRPCEAIDIAQKHYGKIHLLMTDVVMPEMHGRDLAKNILSIYPDIKRLFMSGYTADVIAHHGVLDAGVYFIQKPFSKQELELKIRDVLSSC
ncbi:MAG: response regulator [Desulfamplus sp.]|nr:response regulator [Desulfamplus sp.]